MILVIYLVGIAISFSIYKIKYKEWPVEALLIFSVFWPGMIIAFAWYLIALLSGKAASIRFRKEPKIIANQ